MLPHAGAGSCLDAGIADLQKKVILSWILSIVGWHRTAETVTITIVATITATAGTVISNQATVLYDSEGSGSNDASGTTDAFSCSGIVP